MNSKPKLETVFGKIQNNVLYHNGKQEILQYNQFNRDIPYTYIQILRRDNRIYVVDFSDIIK